MRCGTLVDVASAAADPIGRRESAGRQAALSGSEIWVQ